MATQITFKRGLETARTTAIAATGEPLWTTDKHELWIGDGTTGGGVAVGTLKADGVPTNDQMAIFKDASGRLLKGVDKATFLTDYALKSYVDTKLHEIASGSVTVKVTNAAHSDAATTADKLGGIAASEYMQKGLISQTKGETSTDKVLSAAAIQALNTDMKTYVVAQRDTRVATSAISSNPSETSTDKVASIKVVHDVKATADSALAKANANAGTLSSVSNTANAANSKATAADTLSKNNKTRLDRLPNHTASNAGPTGGKNGDVHFQY